MKTLFTITLLGMLAFGQGCSKKVEPAKCASNGEAPVIPGGYRDTFIAEVDLVAAEHSTLTYPGSFMGTLKVPGQQPIGKKYRVTIEEIGPAEEPAKTKPSTKNK